MARTFRLRGDYVNDFRLIDYLVALLSTDESPALNGIIGNDEKMNVFVVNPRTDLMKYGYGNFG